MNKNNFAPHPPMGWNSYDYYDTTVNEAQIKANAEYMAKYLKPFGYEYVVIDIEWYAHHAGSKRDKYQYIPFEKVEMDEYSRLLPDPARFPSSIGQKGFRPLADYIHSLGLKLGIHIMRGIPRNAAHNHGAILGTNQTANEIADPSSICFWNPDMYGLFPNEEGSQAYYDSLLSLYAEWEIDFIKCDDICRMDMASAKREIEMLALAIKRSKREIVFSLSPGPAKIDEAAFYETHANMWRITDDFWDSWPLLLNMFTRCELWEGRVRKGCYPDCDMLPIGMLGKGFSDEHKSHFTYEELKTMMTLWCIFGSPLMIGGELPLMDSESLELLTNPAVLKLLSMAENAHQKLRTDDIAIWLTNQDQGDGSSGTYYAAVFNLSDVTNSFSFRFSDLVMEPGSFLIPANLQITELWTTKTHTFSNELTLTLPAHGCHVYQFELTSI